MNPEDLAAALDSMRRIRRTEEAIETLRADGEISGSIHLGCGQEAVAVGVAAARAEGDPVFATYRGHAWALACGVPPERLVAELLGRASGVAGGRGGSAQLAAPEWGFMGENAIIGAHLPIAVGAALAARFDGSGRVAIAVFGDGAANQGAVYEAFNLAGAWRLPVVFVLENNLYSELTPISAMVAEVELWRRAEPFGIAAGPVDGNDVAAVAAATSAALERARAGDGPSLIEASTYRLSGHYFGDAETYRDQSEVEAARLREPLVLTRQALREAGVAAERLDQAAAEIDREVEAAVAAALQAPLAEPAAVREHLYA